MSDSPATPSAEIPRPALAGGLTLTAVVRDEMARQGLSFRALARRLCEVDDHGRGLSSSHIANICAGRQAPSLRAIVLLQDALGVGLTALPEAGDALLRSRARVHRGTDGQPTRCQGCGISPQETYPGYEDGVHAFLSRLTDDGPALCANCHVALEHGARLPLPPIRGADEVSPTVGYSAEFKASALQAYRTSDKSMRQVANHLHVSPATLWRWANAAMTQSTP